MKSYDEIEAMLAEHVAQRTGTSANEIDRARRFDHLGIDSADAITLMGELEDFVGRPLSASLPYAYPTIEQLARCVADGDG
jgi:acyl carrier protein